MEAGGEPAAWHQAYMNMQPEVIDEMPVRRHKFTHFELEILPRVIQLKKPGSWVLDETEQVWYNPLNPGSLGLAAPVHKLLKEYSKRCENDSNG